MQNKLEKFLISLSGIFAFILIILGIKIQADSKKIQNFSTELKNIETVPVATENYIEPKQTVNVPSENIRISATNPAENIGVSATNPVKTSTINPVGIGKTVPAVVPVVVPPANKKTKTS